MGFLVDRVSVRHVSVLVITVSLTYVLNPWSRVLLEKLIICQLVKKFSAFYGTRKFIIAFTKARYLSLS